MVKSSGEKLKQSNIKEFVNVILCYNEKLLHLKSAYNQRGCNIFSKIDKLLRH